MLGKTTRLPPPPPPCRRTNDNMGADGERTFCAEKNDEDAACDEGAGALDAVGASMSSSSDCRLLSLSLPMAVAVELELERVMREGGSTPGGGEERVT